MKSFDTLFVDCTKYATKLKTTEYDSTGKYIIIDQGQNVIAGYTDLENGIFDDVPALIFGDHTRCIKYVDKPFFIGADGVKVLKLKEDNNYKYFYYALKSIDIPNTGYNRHFKWLKESSFKEHDCNTQEEIVSKLEKIESIINSKKKQLFLLDDLIKSRFIEMFGDPVTNPKKWNIDKLYKLTNKIGSGATPKGGKESYIKKGISLIRSMNVYDSRFEYKELAHLTMEQARQLNNVIVEENDVLFNITGASVTRSCVVPKNVLPARVNQHVAIIRSKRNMLNPIFLNHLLINDNMKKELVSIGESNGATRQAITKLQLENVNVFIPPLELQEQFAAFIEQIDKSKFGN